MKVTIKTIKCKVLVHTYIRTAKNMLANGKTIRKMEKESFCYKMES